MISSRLELRIRFGDLVGSRFPDAGPQRMIAEGLSWLGRAQDKSATADGGVARHFSIKTGWSASYPETTGYIVQTFLDGRFDPDLSASTRRAFRMLDWLSAIQFPEGGFQGGMVNQIPRVPVTFNTGQILIGLATACAHDQKYRDAMYRAADWLVQTQDEDGCWRKHPTPFANPGEKAYETHVALGLLHAHAVDPGRGYQDAALRQVDWALRQQQPNGWLAKCCLSDATRPLTHTLGYALRGIVAAYESSGQERYLTAALKLADALKNKLHDDGRLAGRFNSEWRPAVSWVCLTGLSQISECWFLLSRSANRPDLAEAGKRANAYVRRTVRLEDSPDIKGAIKGSQPISGDYGKWQYLNWACKFTIDANRAELTSTSRQS